MKSRNFKSTIVNFIATGAANAEFAVAHELGEIPKGAFVLKQGASSILYRSAAVPSTGLHVNFIGGWEFEDNANLGADSGPNALTLTNTNMTQISGVVGNAAQGSVAAASVFSRASESLIQAGDIDFTWATWVRLTNKTVSGIIISKETGVQGTQEYDVYFDQALDRFHGRVWTGPATAVNAIANSLGSPSASVWYFIVLWHDAAANTFNIQVNNGTVDSSATLAPLQAVSTAQLQFGARDFVGSRAYLNGDIDQVMFWKRVLTSTERTQLYNAGAGVTVSTVLANSASIETPWTEQLAYLRSTVAGTEYTVLFFA